VYIIDTTSKDIKASFDLGDVVDSDYTLQPVQGRHSYSMNNISSISWNDDPFTFTNLSDILNIPEIKEKLFKFIDVFKTFDKSADALLEKHAKLLLLKGVI